MVWCVVYSARCDVFCVVSCSVRCCEFLYANMLRRHAAMIFSKQVLCRRIVEMRFSASIFLYYGLVSQRCCTHTLV